MKLSTNMKRLLLLIGIVVGVAAANVVWGQAEGVISYETKINLHRRIPPEREAMKTMIPEFRTTKEQLFFKGVESLYKPVIEDTEDDMTSSTTHGGGGMVMRLQTPNIETYSNTDTQERIVSQEFQGKQYLIVDTLKVSPWKFGTETKTILGYECKQAYFTDEQRGQKMEITAWYTDQISPFLGPERFNTLPGAVLAIDVNNGERVIVAQQVDLKTLKKNDLKRPSSGQKVTSAEFRAMVDEQMKKMGANGGMIIRN